ncbi:hypothetical protein M0R72_14900 [Candidatus Pacearchaeota archaeon]|jgi:hypothetical protein|nr:hypothetical protein [Candidatus Pacearchaeota archaeon]
MPLNTAESRQLLHDIQPLIPDIPFRQCDLQIDCNRYKLTGVLRNMCFTGLLDVVGREKTKHGTYIKIYKKTGKKLRGRS